jgi:RimJ/RimL family protein N-acetyltransferase
MFSPITYENENHLVHPFRPQDLERFPEISREVFSILSDEQTLKFIPAKRLKSPEAANAFVKTMLINTHTGRNFLHFIIDKNLNKVVGLIDLISPQLAREHYRISDYPFFIEFYLGSLASGSYLMSAILPGFVEQILSQGIRSIGAVTNRQNLAAKKVLEKAGFNYKRPFDPVQDFYEISAV